MLKYRIAPLALVAMSILIAPLRADEGMWLFNDLPDEILKKVPKEWPDKIRLASVRFNTGGSASFVSKEGLVITNHHVARSTLQKLSSATRNLARDGFFAATRADEIPAPDLELTQLISMKEVTSDINRMVKDGMTTKAAMAALEARQSKKDESLKYEVKSTIVTLFGGGRYDLYRYRRFTKVKLVWAPEASAAYFGGDPDNFEYPRFCLDVCLFRVYDESGQPYKPSSHLPFAKKSVQEGDLIFVSGNPGRTRRIYTVDALKYQRDHRMPYILDYLRRREVLYQQFGFEGVEQKRRIQGDLFGTQNGRKAYTGMLRGLQDPAIFGKKVEDEEKLKKWIASRDDADDYMKAFEMIAEASEARRKLQKRTATFASRYYSIAETLVLYVAEKEKPNGKRLREFRESEQKSLEQQLYSTAPIYDDVARLKLADSLALFAERRGADDPIVVKALAGKSPQARAAELVEGTKLRSTDLRRKLVAKGIDAVSESKDAMIVLARAMNEENRAYRVELERIQEAERQAYAKIADAIRKKIDEQDEKVAPDATFTLRLSFGTVKGYAEDGQQIPHATNIAGAFIHEANHDQKAPWQLPKSWHDNRKKLNPQTPFNFVSTADIIGGNSGSPVINLDGEFVGIIFDGNIHSLTADYIYSDTVARATSVDVGVIREALDKVYNAQDLLKELGGPETR